MTLLDANGQPVVAIIDEYRPKIGHVVHVSDGRACSPGLVLANGDDPNVVALAPCLADGWHPPAQVRRIDKIDRIRVQGLSWHPITKCPWKR